jgi:hypothetical protein
VKKAQPVARFRIVFGQGINAMDGHRRLKDNDLEKGNSSRCVASV